MATETTDPRPWVKVSVDYFDNPKIDALTDMGQLLHLLLIVKSGQQRTDGVVTRRLACSRGDKAFRELLDAGLLHPRPDGKYEVHDYDKHQTPKAKMRGNPAKGAHTVHHAKRGIVDPNCEFCLADANAKPMQTGGQPPF